MLCSLDSSWDVLVRSLESMQEQDLTMVYLTGQLLEEEPKQLERRPGMGGESILHRPESANQSSCDSELCEKKATHVGLSISRDVVLTGETEEQQYKGEGLCSTCIWIEEDRPEIKREDTEDIDTEDIEERPVTDTQEHIIPRRSERGKQRYTS
ncbi:hypothetical protein E2320_002186 [Naja naja]|nr:hypothetical protein E2320_002186 [Naja naja]